MLRGTDTPQGEPHCLRAQSWQGGLCQQDPQALLLDPNEMGGAGAGGGIGTRQRSNLSPLPEEKWIQLTWISPLQHTCYPN